MTSLLLAALLTGLVGSASVDGSLITKSFSNLNNTEQSTLIQFLYGVGNQKMYNVGENSKTMYGQYIGEYEEKRVLVSSTKMIRTKMEYGSTVNSTEQSSTSLQFVYGFFRHGIRSPLYTPYPMDPNKSKYARHFQGQAGKLTKVGKQQMYKVGKKLKAMYGQFLGGYNEKRVLVSSTNMSRTIMTSLAVMAGLFPPSKPIFKGIKNWQPIPVWEDTSDLDKAYIYNDDNFPALGIQVCPKYGDLIKAGFEIIVNPDLKKGRQLFYKLIQNNTGDPNVNSVDSLYKIWDTLQFETLNGLPLPEWASAPQSDYHNKPLYPKLMEPVMLDWFLDTEFLNQNDYMLSFYSGPLFNSIHQYLLDKANNLHSQRRLRFHATHDTTLFVLLWALKIKKPVTVGPGDGIVFELHVENKKSTVKIMYYFANKHNTVKELVSPLCPSPCSLEDFIKATPGLTPQQWQEMC